MLLSNQTPNQTIEFTQGETIILHLLATDDEGNPVDLTGASLSTQILGPNTVGPIIFPNSQHTIPDQTSNRGQFSLALSSDDTQACADGAHKQIITEAQIASVIGYFRGNNLLTVYVNVPIQ